MEMKLLNLIIKFKLFINPYAYLLLTLTDGKGKILFQITQGAKSRTDIVHGEWKNCDFSLLGDNLTY